MVLNLITGANFITKWSASYFLLTPTLTLSRCYPKLVYIKQLRGENIMKPDLEKYLAMIEDWDMTHEEKIQYIEELWFIMENFADRAFGLHPTQHVGNKSSQADGQDSS